MWIVIYYIQDVTIIIGLLYFSQKQLPRKMKLRLVILVYAGNIFWQLFVRRL